MLDNLRSTYFGNATAARDYRVQLRGSRSVWLFSLYLFILIGFAYTVYTSLASPSVFSVVRAQSMLESFYITVMALLGGMVSLIAPALTATTIAQERQRQSFELLFSAPVTPKYYLVGKIISSYRYVWMLLALSLPVTAAAVLLGGAAWSDVLIAYLLLSLQALIFTSIALLMSTLAPKPVSAVIWTYAVLLAYLSALGSTSGAALFSTGTRSAEQFFVFAMNPFTVTVAAASYTTLLGVQVPNWILATLATLAIVRLVLLSAGTLLSFYGGKEGRALRLNGLAYVFALGLLGGMVGPGSGTSSFELGTAYGMALNWALVPLVAILPFMVCYGYDGERVHRPNGLFQPGRMLDGTPAGALPFLWATVLAGTLGLTLGFVLWFQFAPYYPSSSAYTNASLSQMVSGLAPYAVFAFGFWALMWGFGRAASLSDNLRSARTLQFALFLSFFLLPLPFLSAFGWQQFSQKGFTVWDLWLLRPLTQDLGHSWTQAMGYGALMLIAGWSLAVWSERRFARRIRQDLVEDERIQTAA
ncbi:MAG TPA: hypothetical protein VGE01_05310 [Fimbriimonas sp.]